MKHWALHKIQGRPEIEESRYLLKPGNLRVVKHTFLHSVFTYKHCWPMTICGEIEILEKYLHYSVSGISGEVEENLTFCNENFAKLSGIGFTGINLVSYVNLT